MSDRTEVRVADRAATLIMSAVLMAGLAAILAVSYSLILPLPLAWSRWRLPIVIAAAGGLGLMLVWPARGSAMRARAADGFAVMLGAASMILGIGAAMLIATGLVLNFSEDRASFQTLLYRLTSPWILASILAYAAPAALLGGLGLWIARRRAWAAGRVSAAGVAVRFSAVGLGCAGFIAATVASAAIYRWATWG